MKLKHLGDALDFWKGGLMGRLQGVLNDIHILPMFTEPDVPNTWTPDCLQLYAHLTGVDVSRILHPDLSFSRAHGQKYFDNLRIAIDSDLFVDPDIGIAPEGGGNNKHIRLAELSRLLPSDSTRIVLVYQHRPQRGNKDWVGKCLQRVARAPQLEGCGLFAYEAGHVSMIFLSRDSKRLTAARQALDKFTPLKLTRVISLL